MNFESLVGHINQVQDVLQAQAALTKGLTLCEHSIAILLCTTVDSCPMPCSV